MSAKVIPVTNELIGLVVVGNAVPKSDKTYKNKEYSEIYAEKIKSKKYNSLLNFIIIMV